MPETSKNVRNDKDKDKIAEQPQNKTNKKVWNPVFPNTRKFRSVPNLDLTVWRNIAASLPSLCAPRSTALNRCSNLPTVPAMDIFDIRHACQSLSL